MRKSKVRTRMFVCVVAISFCLLTIIGGVLIYALNIKTNNMDINSKIGQAKIVRVINPYETEKVAISANSSSSFQISIDLNCNVNAVVRVKITPWFYNSLDEHVMLSNDINYNLNTSQGAWVSDANNMCFYFNESVKNISNLKFISGISIPNDSSFNNHKVSFVVEAEILQIAGLDYDNHPWGDNAPSDWLNKFKNF